MKYGLFNGLATSLVFFCSMAHANVGEAYGFGSRTTALGGAGAAWGTGAFAAYYNPAQLGLDSEKRLQLDWGLIYMQPNFKPITNVLTQNKFVSDSQRYSDVDNSTYRETFGQQLGLTYRLDPKLTNLTLGITMFMPVNQFAYMDTGEAYVPEYVLYRARTQRPQVELGAGAKLCEDLQVGIGFHVAFTLTSNASVFINTQKNTASSLRFTSSLKPKAAPYIGLLWAPGKKKNFSLGGVFRFPVTSNNTMTLNSAARVFGNFAAVDFNFTAISALFYDPMAIELGSSWQHNSWGRLFAQVDYQFWSRFEAPALLIQQPKTTNCTGNGCDQGTVNISPGSLPSFNYVNIFVPRFGWEITPGDGQIVYRIGYAYRPSVMSNLPTEGGNYLDPPKHMLNLGVGLNYDSFLSFDVPFRLDFNLAYHYLVTQTVTKTPGNEVGDATDLKIGAPGYTAGGSVYGGGATVSFAF